MSQKLKTILYYLGAIVVAALIITFIVGIAEDTPPKFALNGVELDLKNLRVSDMNEAGFFLGNNDGSLPEYSFKEMLSYYQGNNDELSMGGISVLNSSGSEREYVDCQVFEITAKARDKEGNLTGLEATYNGESFFGKTKEELIELFGEPEKDEKEDKLIYRTSRNHYKTTFYFDKDTGECYLVEIKRHEDNLAR